MRFEVVDEDLSLMFLARLVQPGGIVSVCVLADN